MKTRICVMMAAAVTLAAAAGYAQGRGAGPRLGRQAAPGPGRMLSIQTLDSNKDGAVSRDEFTAGTTRLSNERFAWLDTDGDSVLSPEEIAAAPRPGRGARGPRRGAQQPDGIDAPQGQGRGAGQGRGMGPCGAGQGAPPANGRGLGLPPRLDQFDANADGSVTLQEFQAGSTAMHQDMFGWIDEDADGTLTADELSRAQRPGPPPDAPKPPNK